MKSPILAFALFAVHAHAAGPVAVKANDPKLKGPALFDAKTVKVKDPLVDLKLLEIRGEWGACRDRAAQVKDKDVLPWIARTRLQCAVNAYDPKAKGAKRGVAGLSLAFKAVKDEWLSEGPWSDTLAEAYIDAAFALANENVKSKAKEVRDILDRLLGSPVRLKRPQRATAYELLADAAVVAKDDEQAAFYFRQSLDAGSSASVSGKLAEAEARIARKNKTTVVPPVPAEPVEAAPLGAEDEADREIRALLAEGKNENALRRMIEVQRRFPGGIYAKAYRERSIELVLAAFEKRADNLDALVSIAKEAGPGRLTDWAQVFHRRGFERGALELAEEALETLKHAPLSTSLHWIAGRSASFMGEKEKAAYHFDQLIQFHGGSDESQEASLRLGLMHIRDRNYALAARILERLVGEGKKDDLQARYWRMRCFEKIKDKRFEAERDAIIDRYPFTYYGLRLRAEKNEGKIEFAKFDRSPLEEKPGQFWLVGKQKQAWARFQRLSRAGWINEAQSELALLPVPKDPVSIFQWSQTLARAEQYQHAIIFTNRALEVESTLRHPRYLRPSFPTVYGSVIEPEAQARGIDPDLIRSLIRQESAFSLQAVSRSKAMGLMQLIPPTAQEVAGELRLKPRIPDDMFRPEFNVPMGTYYYAKMLREFSNTVPLALAAYNAGPHRLGRWLRNRDDLSALKGKTFDAWEDEIWYDELPWTETSFYVKAILRNVLIYKLLDQGRVDWSPSFWSALVKTKETK